MGSTAYLIKQKKESRNSKTSFEIIQSEEQKRTNNRVKEAYGTFWDIINQINICIMEVPKGEERG